MELAQTQCGTPLYLSPEVCTGKPYDFKVRLSLSPLPSPSPFLPPSLRVCLPSSDSPSRTAERRVEPWLHTVRTDGPETTFRRCKRGCTHDEGM